MDADPILTYARPTDPEVPVTARGTATIVCRLIAVWMLVQSAGQMVAAIAYLVLSFLDRRAWQGRRSDVWVSFVVVLGPVTAGWLLWSTSGWIGRRVVPDDAPIGPAGGPDVRPLMTVGLVMAGAWTAALSIRDLIGAAVMASQNHVPVAQWWQDTNWLRAVASDAVGLGLSAWLVFGGHGLAHPIQRARTAGHPRPAIPVSTELPPAGQAGV